MLKRLYERFEFARFCTLHRRSLSTIRKWQLKFLQKMVRHASLRIPLWREIFSNAQVTVEDIDSLESLQKIPLTNKRTYIGRMVEEYVDGSRRFFQVWRATSGTSGVPFRYLLASQYVKNLFYNHFSSFRFLLWRGKSLAEMLNTKIACVRHRPYVSESLIHIDYIEFRTDRERVYRQLAEFKPEILEAYPSILVELAKMSSDDETLPPLTPKYILTTGEMLTASVRSFVGQQLKSEVYDRYALGELGVIGTECLVHNGFHINSESFIVEITDEKGSPVSENARGKIIITDLFNYNMPFIRYDTGDVGSISYESCACGLNSPRLWLEGRVSVSLLFGTRHIYRHEFLKLDTLMHDILQYQLVKRSENMLLVRVQAGPLWNTATNKKVESAIREIVGNDMDVIIELVSSIARAPSGKVNLLVDESV